MVNNALYKDMLLNIMLSILHSNILPLLAMYSMHIFHSSIRN